jgi:hypothetical protein
MASQRITIAKIAGLSGEIALERLSAWAAARNTDDPNTWFPGQWPDHVRREVDDFAGRLREHGFALPVCYFAEWADMWSMGDTIEQWLTPPNCPKPGWKIPNGSRPIWLYSNRFQVYAYALPDDGQLAKDLAAPGPQQFDETDWFVARLREAVSAWGNMVPRATLVAMRYIVGDTALDEAVTASLNTPAPWLS